MKRKFFKSLWLIRNTLNTIPSHNYGKIIMSLIVLNGQFFAVGKIILYI